MGVVQLFHELYSLDTLDTRFTTSSSTPLKIAEDKSARTTTEDDKPASQLPAGASPPKWKTPEFFFYLLVFLFCVPNMYLAVVQVSQPTSPNYKKYEHLLSDGWLFGRKVDNSDGQYAGFRDNIPYLAILLVLHPLLRRAFESMTGASTPDTANGSIKSSTSRTADGRLNARLNFDFVFAFVFIFALHGFSALKVLLILYINFNIATSLPRAYIPAATWIFNIAILFTNELARGYPYATMTSAILPSYVAASDLGKFLDSYSGLIPRWEVLFNITVLRLISFNIDHYWSLDQPRSGSLIEVRLFYHYLLLH